MSSTERKGKKMDIAEGEQEKDAQNKTTTTVDAADDSRISSLSDSEGKESNNMIGGKDNVPKSVVEVAEDKTKVDNVLQAQNKTTTTVDIADDSSISSVSDSEGEESNNMIGGKDNVKNKTVGGTVYNSFVEKEVSEGREAKRAAAAERSKANSKRNLDRMCFEQNTREKMFAIEEGVKEAKAMTKELPEEEYFKKAALLKRKEEMYKFRNQGNISMRTAKIRRLQRERFGDEELQLLLSEDQKEFNKVFTSKVKGLEEEFGMTSKFKKQQRKINTQVNCQMELLIKETKKSQAFTIEVEKLFRPQKKVVGRVEHKVNNMQNTVKALTNEINALKKSHQDMRTVVNRVVRKFNKLKKGYDVESEAESDEGYPLPESEEDEEDEQTKQGSNSK